MKSFLSAAILASAAFLAGCEVDEPTIGGTVVRVMEAEQGGDMDRAESSGKFYEDPFMPEVAWKLEVRLDDGAAVTVIHNGTRRYEPGARVRLLRDEDGALLL